MRYLNKIIFINSAHIKYAEINLDGNVHFIGTQGVGKSTVLRAILFFYNADTFGLGIPKQKDSYTDYYFKNSNSYVIYEVARSEGKFCVVSYKYQHKVCFRFFDGEFQQDLFVSETGNVPDSWEGIAHQLDLRKIYYTKRKVDEHKEYRDILYGNHDGKRNELKRYSILESKEYQYIPKTIQNVFLNSKMEAEFIKQTIIMSLENDIRIDLNQHAHHLKDFETQLNDIRKFKTPGTFGQANTISKLHIAIRHLDREKIQLTKELACALDRISTEEPLLSENLEKKKSIENLYKTKLSKAEDSFKSKERKISGEISVLDDKLKTARKLSEEYEKRNIFQILERVTNKPSLEKERNKLLEEKELLSIQFKELTQKFQVLLERLENRFNDFLNSKEAERNSINSDLLTLKDEIKKKTEKTIAEIRKEHFSWIEALRADWESKKQSVNSLKIKREEIKHTRFLEKEIDAVRTLISELERDSLKQESECVTDKREIESFEKQWELDKKDLEKTLERELEKLNDLRKSANDRISEIGKYIENSKDSFYGWLNDRYPDWELTIGKVIDERNVLFNTSLSPKLTDRSNNFYGIELDLNEINKNVRTIAEYELDINQLGEEINAINSIEADRMAAYNRDSENLKRKYLPKIRERKERIKENGYILEQNKLKQGEATIRLNGLISDAGTRMKEALDNISKIIAREIESELAIKNDVDAAEEALSRVIKAKEKDRDKKIEAEEESVKQRIFNLVEDIKNEEVAYLIRKEEIKSQKESSLLEKGADTSRMKVIDERLDYLQAELGFIEEHRDVIADYKKDKRDYIDRTEEFRNNKSTLEKQLDNEQKKFAQSAGTITRDMETIQAEITELTRTIESIIEDKEAFLNFKLTECYSSVQEYLFNAEGDNLTEKSVKMLIDEIKEIHYDRLNSRMDELRRTTIDFLGKFSDENIFKFRKQLSDNKSFLDFATMLSDFVEDNKIDRIEKEVNERFALIITTLGVQTSNLISESGKIQAVIKKINDDFIERNFVGVIKKIELKIEESKNEIVQLLLLIKKFNDENSLDLGSTNLFSSESQEKKNKEAIDILKQFVKKISDLKRDYISLSDSFELKFRIEENQNDTGWVEKLSNVGSDGTDVLVKAMVNIMLLNVFKEGASKRFKDFRLHCMMDEIGKLHPNNVRGILKFANDRNILLINSSPIENDALAFKHIYKLKKDERSNNTRVNRILTQFSEA